MTKTITVPLSKETCGKISYGIGLTCGFGSVILLTLTMFSIYFDWWNSYADTGSFTAPLDLLRSVAFAFSGVGNAIVLWIVLAVMHDRGHWINVQCNCDKKDKEVETQKSDTS